MFPAIISFWTSESGDRITVWQMGEGGYAYKLESNTGSKMVQKSYDDVKLALIGRGYKEEDAPDEPGSHEATNETGPVIQQAQGDEKYSEPVPEITTRVGQKLEQMGFKPWDMACWNYGRQKNAFIGDARGGGAYTKVVGDVLRSFGFKKDAQQFAGHINFTSPSGEHAQIGKTGGNRITVTLPHIWTEEKTDEMFDPATMREGKIAPSSFDRSAYGLRWRAVKNDRQSSIVTREKWFATGAAREKFANKLEMSDGFLEIVSYAEPENVSNSNVGITQNTNVGDNSILSSEPTVKEADGWMQNEALQHKGSFPFNVDHMPGATKKFEPVQVHRYKVKADLEDKSGVKSTRHFKTGGVSDDHAERKAREFYTKKGYRVLDVESEGITESGVPSGRILRAIDRMIDRERKK